MEAKNKKKLNEAKGIIRSIRVYSSCINLPKEDSSLFVIHTIVKIFQWNQITTVKRKNKIDEI